MDIINHIEFPVEDAGRSRIFYEAALAPLELSLVMSFDPDVARSLGARHGFGKNNYPRLWIQEKRGAVMPVHVAFTATDRETVDRFYTAALVAGGVDNGKPGIRGHYHANYYAAYILDPDGHNIEAVCQTG